MQGAWDYQKAFSKDKEGRPVSKETTACDRLRPRFWGCHSTWILLFMLPRIELPKVSRNWPLLLNEIKWAVQAVKFPIWEWFVQSGRDNGVTFITVQSDLWPNVCAAGAQQHATNLSAISSAHVKWQKTMLGCWRELAVMQNHLPATYWNQRSQSRKSLSKKWTLETLPLLPGNSGCSF